MNKRILSNKFLILVEIAKSQPKASQVEIARELDLTPQAISDHIKELDKNGLIEKRSREISVTKKGIQLIINSLKELEETIDDVKSDILNKAPCKAIATEKINEGDKVNLFMNNGVLRASKAISDKKTIGEALNPAEKNEEVEIKNVSGIIDLKKGEAKLLVIPRPSEGGSSKLENIEMDGFEFDKLFTIGIGAIALSKKLDLTPDFLFAEPSSVIKSLLRGMDCLILVDEENKEDLLEKLEEQKIDYKIDEHERN